MHVFLEKVGLYLRDITENKRYGFFSKSSKEESIYALCYYIMLCHLLDFPIPENIKVSIRDILLNSQAEDGFCYDKNIINYEYLIGDGWGKRHFIPHYYIALTALDEKPIYKFNYLEPFLDPQFIYAFWDTLDWTSAWKSSNVFMNIVCALQYERDYLGNKDAVNAIEASKKWLIQNVDKEYGMWIKGKINSKPQKLEAIRAAYHMYPILLYDHEDFPYKENVIDTILGCQNKYGGFDLRRNSSACEDIDAIDPLIRFSSLIPEYRKDDVRNAVKRAFTWIMQNQMEDGGCVFRLGEFFSYGHENMTSGINQSNLFATWFRTLSVCYMYNFLQGEEKISLNNLPGYEFPIEYR